MEFTYHRAVAPMMWVFFALAGIEILVAHFLIALFNPWIALFVSAVSLPILAWIVLMIRSFRKLPVRIGDGVLLMRVGTLRAVTVPLHTVAGLRATFDGAAVKDKAVVNLALIAWPNVMVDLREPVAGRRGPIRAVAHRLDDPAAFAAALAQLQRGDGHG